MKMNLKNLKSNKLLKDKNVLSVVFIVTLMNLFGYIMIGDINSILVFTAVALTAIYFTKNMIIVLLTGIVLVNLYVIIRNYSLKEGMKEGGEYVKKVDNLKAAAAAMEDKDKVVNPNAAAAMEDFTDLKKEDKKKPSKKQINPDLMKQVLGPSMDLSNVNNELKNIEEKQLLAMRSIEKLTPLMGMANDMLKRLENIKDKPLV